MFEMVSLYIVIVTLIKAKTKEINTKWKSLKFPNLPSTENKDRSV